MAQFDPASTFGCVENGTAKVFYGFITMIVGKGG